MEAATTGPEPVQTRQKRAEESTYVVQVLSYVGGDLKDAPQGAWVDVATVTVPARSKRKSVITAGLKKAGLEIGADPIEVRALDAESAHVLTVGLETPEPQLRIA